MNPTPLRALCLVPLFALLPGCIVQEIRDEIKGVNAKLVTVDAGLNSTNAQLEQVNQRLTGVGGGLDATNVKLKDVESGLGRIDATNQSLGSVQERLALLASIERSLTHLDAHLAALRKTIGKLDSAIPFLDLGGDAPIESPSTPVASAPPAEGTPSTPSTPSATATDQPAAPARDPLIGPWITAHPSDSFVLLLLADGRFVQETGDTARIKLRGTWKRTANVISFQCDDQQKPAPAGSPEGTPPETVPGPAWEVTILHQTAKSLSLDTKSGLRVLTRP
jgi:hypothetical protein